MKSKLTIVNFMLDDKDAYVKTIGKNKNPILVTENTYYRILQSTCEEELATWHKSEDALLEEKNREGYSDIELSRLGIKESQDYIKFTISANKRANFLWKLKSAEKITQSLLQTIEKESCQIMSKIGTQNILSKPSTIIYQSYDSTKLLKAPQIAILVPYFKDKEGNVKLTQSVKWMKEMIGKNKITKEVWL